VLVRRIFKEIKILDPNQYHIIKYALIGILFFLNGLWISFAFYEHNYINTALLIFYFSYSIMGFMFILIIQYSSKVNYQRHLEIQKEMFRAFDEQMNIIDKK